MGLSVNDARLSYPQPANEDAFREVFKRLLENPGFLADGGTLAFGLRHVYPIENNLEHVYNVLKGSDAVVYQSVRALGYEPVLCLYYRDEFLLRRFKTNQGVIIDKIIDFPKEGVDDDSNRDSILLQEGGILVSEPSQGRLPALYSTEEDREKLEWVTPVTEFNRQESAYLHYGNDSSLGWAYGDVCLIVRIGKAGDRLAYTTVAELRKAHESG
jgi:hypothetical protein